MPEALVDPRVEDGRAHWRRGLPATVGRFTLLGPLGEGGMGRVFRAELRGRDGFRKIVALKLLQETVGPLRRAVRAALLHEARIGALLLHPNVVDVYDYGVDDGRAWVALEYVDGVTLEAVLRSRARLPPTVALDIGIQLCLALAHIHSLNDGTTQLVHRDLKPSNILLSRHGVVKLTDFGIAKTDLVSGCTTATGTMKGTPSFIAPEQILGKPVDGRADLFAAGAILYELATGRRLFRRHHSDAMIAAVLAVDEVISPPAVMEEVDRNVPGLASVVEMCLQRDPDLRFATAQELAAELESLRVGMSGPDLRSYRPHLGESARADIPRLPDCAIEPARRETTGDVILRLARSPRVEPRAVFSGPRAIEAAAARKPRSRVGAALLAVAHTTLFLTALTWGGPSPSPAQPAAVVVVTAPAPDVVEESPEPFVDERSDPAAPAAPSWEDDRPDEAPARVATRLAPAAAAPPVVERGGTTPEIDPTPTPPTGTLSHPHPVTKADVGQRRSFIVRVDGEAESVALLLTHGGAPAQMRALSPFRNGFWGLVVPFFADMQGEVTYRFEGPGLEPTHTYTMHVGSTTRSRPLP